jgi:hypothetical protein
MTPDSRLLANILSFNDHNVLGGFLFNGESARLKTTDFI